MNNPGLASNIFKCYISAEDFARISGYDDIVKTISSTPVLPQWSYGTQPNGNGKNIFDLPIIVFLCFS